MIQEKSTVFQLIGLSKYFAGKAALRKINLDIDRGKTTVLIGPSGCGKSTTLRLMIGLIRAEEGKVTFEETELSSENALRLRRRMGYVIQNGGLFPHLSARANITIMARFLGWERSRIMERIEELAGLTRFPLDGLKRYPAQLSGGQQQRVALMRALMLDPAVLLLDEPLGALDPMIRSELQHELKDIFRLLGKTVVLVTHDLNEAAFLGHRIVLMRHGSIIQQGRIGELLSSPVNTFVSQFIKAQQHFLDNGGEQA